MKTLESTRVLDGPDIDHLGILPQFGQNIDLLSFSCSVLLLVKKDFSSFILCYFSKGCHLDRSILI